MFDTPLGFFPFVPEDKRPSDPWGSQLVVYACGVITGLILAAIVVAR